VKPLEVEIAVLSIGKDRSDDKIYRISFDGSISDEDGFTAIGGKADAIHIYLKEHYRPESTIQSALETCVKSLEDSTGHGLAAQSLEVAVLDRKRQGRKFRRLSEEEVRGLLPAK
jgi:proteasome alpha subunit